MKEAIGIMLWGLFCFLLGTITHENDMARNCAKDGNAAAWFNEIKCEKSE